VYHFNLSKRTSNTVVEDKYGNIVGAVTGKCSSLTDAEEQYQEFMRKWDKIQLVLVRQWYKHNEGEKHLLNHVGVDDIGLVQRTDAEEPYIQFALNPDTLNSKFEITWLYHKDNYFGDYKIIMDGYVWEVYFTKPKRKHLFCNKDVIQGSRSSDVNAASIKRLRPVEDYYTD
jgi:hypothetical protein